MKVKNDHIINAFTNLDELIQGLRNGPLNPLLIPKKMFESGHFDLFLSQKKIFEMGQFYEWARPIVESDDTDLEAATEVPEEFAWVVEEALRLR